MSEHEITVHDAARSELNFLMRETINHLENAYRATIAASSPDPNPKGAQ